MPDPVTPVVPSADIAPFERALAEVEPRFHPVDQADRPVENSAFYEFGFYDFLFPTETGGYQGILSERALATVDDFQAAAGGERAALLLDLLARIETAVWSTVRSLRRGDWDVAVVLDDLLSELYRQRATTLPDVLSAYQAESIAGIGANFLDFLATQVATYVRDRLLGAYPVFVGFWAAWPVHFAQQYMWWHDWVNHDPAADLPDWIGPRPRSQAQIWRDETRDGITPDRLPFEVFDPGSVNLGLQLVFRQDWRHLGTQPGEIVRTIPLGPGQTERITVKLTRRQRRTATLESSRVQEVSTESAETTKDSSEIVSEAAESSNWKLGHSGTGSYSFFGGSISASHSVEVGESSEERSRETSASLSEAMSKTASRTRAETKVSVVTESEESLETERFSEIRNPNNESAITYEYLKLQHQYEVFTRLAEVRPVVFVAEALPVRIDEAWVRRHDWIVARALLDESHRETLNDLIREVDQTVDLDPDGYFSGMVETAQDRFANFEPNTGGQGGLTIPDIYAQPQRTYQEEVRARDERRRANEVRRIRRERLFLHITDNLLHYCRQVWLAEDGDQRILRYKKEGRRVPIEWRGPLAFEQIGGDPAARVSDLSPTGRQAELWEVVDPTGPISYTGNYAVFALRPFPPHYRVSVVGSLDDLRVAIGSREVLLGISEILGLMSAPYADPTTGALRDPARATFERDAAGRSPQALRRLDDDTVYDLVSYLPHLESVLVDAAGAVIRTAGLLDHQITAAQWAEYRYRRHNTRRFLVDSNNLYLNIRPSGGAALEPFKRAHRLVDVLRAAEELRAEQLKNARREALIGSGAAFDPDIDKVVVVGDGAVADAVAGAAATTPVAVNAPVPVPAGPAVDGGGP